MVQAIHHPTLGGHRHRAAGLAITLLALIVLLAAVVVTRVDRQASSPGSGSPSESSFSRTGDGESWKSMYFGSGAWARSGQDMSTCVGGLECLLLEPLNRSSAPTGN